MNKIFLIVGVRPHFVKISSLLKELEKNFNVVLIHTCQHYDYNMSTTFFEDLGIRNPDYMLVQDNVMENEKFFGMSIEICKLINKEWPKCILVIGDSNTPLAAALAGKISNVKVAHIEAGVRNYDENMVEEANRTLIDRISDIYFTTTKGCIENLKRENINNNIFFVGDLLLEAINKTNKTNTYKKDVVNTVGFYSGYILLTMHRKENTSNKNYIREVMESLNEMNYKVIFPMHPKVKSIFLEDKELKEYFDNEKILLIDAVNHEDIVKLIENSQVVVTDSNGIQRESYFLKKPCIILRTSTEVKETLKNNCAVIIGNNITKMKHYIDYYMENPKLIYELDQFGGDGVSEKISKILYEYLENSEKNSANY
ncbi:non-hydrolyzing UDP-N-acetylglucosamine 2-epimerase [Clostridium cellulovorans]|uniref:UDP-N-acetylglucosamine 2-epimerase n=1 Tax=Clostridium cellulovorans (strain ATCC 35296 / DSM 3052 / OCM 3 / 743B) TaxID=573061 RepID=D9SU71_CLOC7|nr:UDP-N-acetylglucosamine 2-epimerase (non-hydrolyzing) [Clostridium cellulovorans]ADL52826.1 UDP-N-acetylglucosamine 2-epimerase [Clostridium cellulovorans 743B]